MCGIVGYFGDDFSSKLPEMLSLIVHRGPDDFGTFMDQKIGLAMRRLSIIDLESGHQPMQTEDGDFVIVFNGEIYNYKELRGDLTRESVQLRTQSDTEVILQGYAKYGSEYISKLRGMFAIAIWDRRRQKLFLWRDRIGEKPLFYISQGPNIAFASEIKSLLPVVSVRKVDQESVKSFVALGYLPYNRTMFRDIKKLPPGHMMVIDASGSKLTKYWSPRYDIKPMDFDAARNEIEKELCTAIEIGLRSDVEVGAFLSGGLDSSLLTAIAAKKVNNIKTFSIGYHGAASGFNELRYSAEVAKYIGSDHREIIIEAESNIDLLPKIIWHYDEPHGEPTSILIYQLCAAVAKEVKVAISGTGADEVFFGYPRHKGGNYFDRFSRLPKWCRTFVRDQFVRLGRESTQGSRLAKRARKFLEAANGSAESACEMWLAQADNQLVAKLVNSDANLMSDGFRSESEFLRDRIRGIGKHQSFLQAMSRVDIEGYLPEFQLAYVDRMSMANSLEVRSPFCDYRLIEKALSLPEEFRLKRQKSKYILKEIGRRHIPGHIVDRKKVGFDSPIGQWFKDELRGFLFRFLSKENLSKSGLLFPDMVQNIIGLHVSGRRDYSLLLWSIVALEMWFRMYIENEITDFKSFDIHEIRGILP